MSVEYDLDSFPKFVRSDEEVVISAGRIGDVTRSVYVSGVPVPGSSHRAYIRIFLDYYYMADRSGVKTEIYKLGIARPVGNKVVATGFIYDRSSGRYTLEIKDWKI